MIETRRVEVEGRTYEVTQFSATKGIKMMTRLTKLLGEPMGMLFAGGDADAEQVIPAAIRALAERMDEDLVIATIKELLHGVRDSNGEIDFDLHFAGKMSLLFKVLGKVIEVQYGDFLGGLVAKGSGPLKRAAAKAKA